MIQARRQTKGRPRDIERGRVVLEISGRMVHMTREEAVRLAAGCVSAAMDCPDCDPAVEQMVRETAAKYFEMEIRKMCQLGPIQMPPRAAHFEKVYQVPKCVQLKNISVTGRIQAGDVLQFKITRKKKARTKRGGRKVKK